MVQGQGFFRNSLERSRSSHPCTVVPSILGQVLLYAVTPKEFIGVGSEGVHQCIFEGWHHTFSYIIGCQTFLGQSGHHGISFRVAFGLLRASLEENFGGFWLCRWRWNRHDLSKNESISWKETGVFVQLLDLTFLSSYTTSMFMIFGYVKIHFEKDILVTYILDAFYFGHAFLSQYSIVTSSILYNIFSSQSKIFLNIFYSSSLSHETISYVHKTIHMQRIIWWHSKLLRIHASHYVGSIMGWVELSTCMCHVCFLVEISIIFKKKNVLYSYA